jgi:hypothetical protein
MALDELPELSLFLELKGSKSGSPQLGLKGTDSGLFYSPS